MKKVAGSIKLELAQYREMAAFAQFGSDLRCIYTKTFKSRFKTNRTFKTKSILTINCCRQVIISFTGVRGYLDDVELIKLKILKKIF